MKSNDVWERRLEGRGGSVTRHDSSLLSSAGISAVYLLVLEIMIFIKPAACSLLTAEMGF